MSKQVFSTDFYGKNLTVEVGELAKQANGSVLVRYDDTVILSTAVAGKEPKSVDFFPLTVTYEEKLYSVGKIPGGFLKREGRPSEHGTLTARMIDRPIRPLFADGFRNEVQVVNTVLSVDQQASPEPTEASVFPMISGKRIFVKKSITPINMEIILMFNIIFFQS